MFYYPCNRPPQRLKKCPDFWGGAEERSRSRCKPRSIDQVKGEIVFRDAVFGYGQGPIIMDRFDLKLEAGQTVAVVGQNRCRQINPGQTHLTFL